MESLPLELVELILVDCEAKALAVAVPRVSKLFKKLSDENSSVWKAKWAQRKWSANTKPANLSWKRHYFNNELKLFPMFDMTITKTTHEELKNAPSCEHNKSGSMDYITIKEHNFWVINGVFSMLYLTYTDYLPQSWVDQGLSFAISWNELKELIKKKVGNYRVTRQPQRREFQNKDCFSAELKTIVRQEFEGQGYYYQITFNFNYQTGDETSAKTLYGITVRGDEADSVNDSRGYYAKRECKDSE